MLLHQKLLYIYCLTITFAALLKIIQEQRRGWIAV